MANFQLSIVTPAGKAFEGSAQSVIVPGAEGFFEVLANHAPMVVILKKGIVTLTQDAQKKYFAIGPGVLEVCARHETLLLSDFVVSAANLSEAQEKLVNAHA